jgi:signal peptidase II
MTRASGLVWLWLSGLVIGLDLLTKRLILANLEYQDSIPFTSFFNLVHVRNTGAAFSLFADQPGWQRGFFIAIALLVSAVIIHLLRKSQGRVLFCLSLALVLGGAIGNVIDRIAYGHVIDFLDFYWSTWHWPAFNVADIAITLGATMLVWDSLREPGPKQA